MGAGTQGVLPAPRRAAERHQATPPLGGPSGRSSAGQRAPACPTMGRPSPCVPGPSAERGGVGAHHRMDVCAPDRRLLAMGPGVAGPPGHCHRGTATVAMDSHSPGCSGKIQVPCGVCSAQVPMAPEQRAPSTTRSVQRAQYRQSSAMPYEPTSESTMGTWASWRRSAWLLTPRGC